MVCFLSFCWIKKDIVPIPAFAIKTRLMSDTEQYHLAKLSKVFINVLQSEMMEKMQEEKGKQEVEDGNEEEKSLRVIQKRALKEDGGSSRLRIPLSCEEPVQDADKGFRF